MAIQRGALLFIWLVITCFLSITLAIPGEATYYNYTNIVPSACFGLEDPGVMVAAVNDQMWQNKAACGRKYRVTCTGPPNERLCKNGSVTVEIVDRCAGCDSVTIDLSVQAFNQISDALLVGRISVDYTQV